MQMYVLKQLTALRCKTGLQVINTGFILQLTEQTNELKI